MAKIIMLKGLPASGKSTWAKEKVKTGNYMRISKDDIREKMLGGYTPRKERDVLRIRNNLIRQAIELGRNVIVDDTNLNSAHEKTIRRIAKELGVPLIINDSFLEVPPEECVKRDLARDKSVGATVIWGMHDQYLVPSQQKRLDTDWQKRRCVIFDIDGTLAHMTGRNPYDYNRVMEDEPDALLVAVADSLKEVYGKDYLDIIIVSGRNEDCRELTERWLDENMVPYTHLYMRKQDDKRDDTIVKEEIYRTYIEPEYAVLGVFDDRPKVCRMWRRIGLKVAQVGNPYVEF